MSQHAPARRTIGALVAVVTALMVTGCGAVDEDDLFKNMNGHDAPTTSSQGTPQGTPPGDAPPNHADNSRVTRAAAMDPRDEKDARAKAAEAEKALDASRRRGDVGPAAVRTALGRLVGPSVLSVNRLRPARSGAREEGSEFSFGVGATACVSGSVAKNRVAVDVHGPYPDTGCGAPPFTH
ncbi:hypothetical protein ACSNOK_04845 [Streptomyces sp. URMC 126]|uniref:hypothetical protein n=1 Tax=Streptomyces sp. URMC 126 TaxID=3423401 RepID=UPI003F1C355B